MVQKDKDFLDNAKMEYKRIIAGEIYEFNSNMASLLLSFSAFYLSIYKTDKLSMSLLTLILFVAALSAIVVLEINLNMKKQNAGKILFIIDKIENKVKILKRTNNTY